MPEEEKDNDIMTPEALDNLIKGVMKDSDKGSGKDDDEGEEIEISLE